MFALLGEIVFELMASPNAFQSSKRWNYAEHQVVEAAPRLQWVGDSLETITVEMMFHASFTDPAVQMAALTAAASDHGARPLIFGNGDHRGYFVISAINTSLTQMSDAGDTIAIKARVTLTEWAPGAEFDPNAPPRPSFVPIAAVAGAVGAPTGPAIYSAPGGVAANVAAPTAIYVAPTLAAPGVSPILNNPTAAGAIASKILPADVLTAAIVRTPV
ncbi:MAG TPA: phage tail protein [Candidatus Binataceae bacterium]|nr:phage tail protein [Candidatus Binataceae bacterium]